MTVITLATDFGLRNGFVGIMKGVIYRIAPQVKIVDISHAIAPQDVHEGAFTLWRAVPFFPSGTVHIYVVDPGVGTKRRPLAARLGDQYFVGPDNGLLTPLIEEAEQNQKTIEFIHLNNQKYWLPKISRTFHGRDIFAPSGAHLANGVPWSELGMPFHDPVRMQLPRPEKKDNGWIAHITVIDVFGNLTTDLPVSALQGRTGVSFRLRGAEVRGIAESYGHKQSGELVAVVDSEDFLEIALVNGSAAEKLDAKVGDVVEVIIERDFED
ncbi:MAG TPA: SAM-dependent chlorinase/fluorinase [Anaerolineales bacterium]|nr:SAM-dependent chlorinase/fluorinase [Anaerolineales bacterium]